MFYGGISDGGTIDDSKSKYEVKFDLNGAGGSIPTQYFINISTATALRPDDPTWDGHVFLDWYTDKDCTTKYNFGDVVSGDITLYAGFEPVTYDVAYDPGAYGTGDIAKGTKTHGVDFTLSDETFTRDYYTQVGWATAENGEKVYGIGDTYTANASVTLYPVWEAISYTFTIDVSTTVKQGGNTVPGEAAFTVEPISDKLPEAYANITVSGGSVVTNGVGTYSARLTITGTIDDLRVCFAEGMYFRQKNGGLDNWVYDDTVWALWLIENDVSILSDSLEDSTYTMAVYPVVYEELEDGERYYYTDLDADPVGQMRFTNTYTKNIHVHDYQQKYDKDQHWDECACGDKQSIEAHKFGEWKVTRDATETAVGEKERVCSVCGYKETAEIAKLSNTDSPKTGDNSNLTLWFTLLAVSAAGVIGTGMYGKKKRRTR